MQVYVHKSSMFFLLNLCDYKISFPAERIHLGKVVEKYLKDGIPGTELGQRWSGLCSSKGDAGF